MLIECELELHLSVDNSRCIIKYPYAGVLTHFRWGMPRSLPISDSLIS